MVSYGRTLPLEVRDPNTVTWKWAIRLHESVSSIIIRVHLIAICFLLLLYELTVRQLWFELIKGAGNSGLQFGLMLSCAGE